MPWRPVSAQRMATMSVIPVCRSACAQRRSARAGDRPVGTPASVVVIDLRGRDNGEDVRPSLVNVVVPPPSDPSCWPRGSRTTPLNLGSAMSNTSRAVPESFRQAHARRIPGAGANHSRASGREAWPNTYRQPAGVRTYVSLNQSVKSKGFPLLTPCSHNFAVTTAVSPQSRTTCSVSS